jgi:signal transduction histidine kinase
MADGQILKTSGVGCFKISGMRLSRLNANWWLLMGGIVLLAWLGVKQYRWIERASEAERQERHQFLRTALGGIRNDFSERLLKLLTTLRPESGVRAGTEYAALFGARIEQWRKESADSALLGSVTIGWIEESGHIQCLRMGASEKAFSDSAWPPALANYRTVLEQRSRPPGGEPFFSPEGITWSWEGSQLSLVFPIIETLLPPRLPSNDGWRPPPEAPAGPQYARSQPRGPAPPILRGWCSLEIERESLRRMLAELVMHYFGEVGTNTYQVALLNEEPHQVIYQSAPAEPAWRSMETVDEELPLFVPPRPERLPRQPEEIGYGKREPPPRPGDDRRGRFFADPPQWRLVARHKAGSLDEAVSINRRQNLALSTGALLLLLGSGILLVLSTHRARRLARRQIEFVAGVSHELRTPLTVIQTTSYNLAQGKVSDGGRVQQYGEAIQKEVRRLSTQVEQMLSFAGIESGRKLYDLSSVNVGDLITRALSEYGPTFEAEGWQVERQIATDLPMAQADAEVLETILKNLVQNALKYAGKGRWLGISAEAAHKSDGSEIQITIADRGPGIEAKDLPHVFEPFYRGRNKTTGATMPGVGLGLSLVQRHLQAMGGRITVKTAIGQGTAFTMHLPLKKPD